jgi:hypothetical protein
MNTATNVGNYWIAERVSACQDGSYSVELATLQQLFCAFLRSLLPLHCSVIALNVLWASFQLIRMFQLTRQANIFNQYLTTLACLITELIHRVFQEESAILRYNISHVNLCRYKQTPSIRIWKVTEIMTRYGFRWNSVHICRLESSG